MVIPKDSEYISLPKNYTSVEVYKKIDGDWSKIFSLDTSSLANDSIALDSLTTTPSDTLEKIDSLSLNQQEKKAKPNLNKIKNKTDDGAKENPKVLLPKKQVPPKQESPIISKPIIEIKPTEKSIAEVEKEPTPENNPNKFKPPCFRKVGKVKFGDKFIAGSMSIDEIEKLADSTYNMLYEAVRRNKPKQIKKHQSKLDQLCRMLHHKKAKQIKKDNKNK